MRVDQLGVCVSLSISAALLGLTTQAVAEEQVFTGEKVHLGKGSAQAFVRSENGQATAVGIMLSADSLNGLSKPKKGRSAYASYLIKLPASGPKTVFDHIEINWEPKGHPPPKVYDKPHFDFHFYLSDQQARNQVHFKSDADSADPSQQPPAEQLPQGFIVPPGTAVNRMGVHAINPASPEFQGKPFTSTFIYGYYNKQLSFFEPMVSLDFLKSKPQFSEKVARPAAYAKPGAYPSAYSIKYDDQTKMYTIALEELKEGG